MTRAETTEVPWTVEALTAVGFSRTDATRLVPRLPLIAAEMLVAVENDGDRYAGWPLASPPAVVIWYTHDLGSRQAGVLASMGRGLLDLIVILDAIKATKAKLLWDSAAMGVASEWASERTVPRGRLTAYIAAGVASEEAARFEADPASRPSGEQLQLLAALRTQPRT